MKPTPQLDSLASACWEGGACNAGGILRSLSKALDELDFGQVLTHPAVPIILGQVNYLLGEAPGPTPGAVEKYLDYCKQQVQPAALAA